MNAIVLGAVAYDAKVVPIWEGFKAHFACVLDANRLAFAREGLFAPNQLRVLLQTAPYDHCNFTVLTDTPAIARFRELLLAMSYDDPAVRPLLDMEGLTRWLPGRTSGYALLERAVDARPR